MQWKSYMQFPPGFKTAHIFAISADKSKQKGTIGSSVKKYTNVFQNAFQILYFCNIWGYWEARNYTLITPECSETYVYHSQLPHFPKNN